MNEPVAIVTGAAGFIGSALTIGLLEQGHRVVGIDNFHGLYDPAIKRENVRRIQSAASDRFELIEADVCDALLLSQIFRQRSPQTVYHFAAMAGVRPSIADPSVYAAVNITGTSNVLEACRASGCRNVVFASSSSVYGNNARVPFAEADPADQPISPYAATKRAGEIIFHSYARAFGMRIAVLRLFTVFGPAQRPDLAISKFMRLIAADEELPMFGDGSSSRDYTFIDDAVRGIISAAHVISGRQVQQPAGLCQAGGSHGTSAPGELPGGGFFRLWNIGSDRPIELRQVIDIIARVVGKPARIRALPAQMGDVDRTWADLSRSRAELAFEPATSFESGLRAQWRYEMENNYARPEVKIAIMPQRSARTPLGAGFHSDLS